MKNLFELKQLKPINIAGVKKSRFIQPPSFQEIDDFRVKYKNAEALANEIEIKERSRHFAIIDGKFIFGDFIEALIVKNNWLCEELIISTLTMSQDNIDSLRNLLVGDYVRELNLLLSDYFFSHERDANGLVPYMYEKLDYNDITQVAFASVHTKITLIRTSCGKKIVIHGSANMRSSKNVEQICIEENAEMFDFCREVHMAIIEKYKTINKSVRYETLWREIIAAGQPEALESGNEKF